MTEPSVRAVPQAWTRTTIAPADWTVPLPEAAKRELQAVRDELRRAPVPTFLLDARDFALDACRATMAEVRRVTQSGPMFAVLDQPGIGRYPVAATPLQFGAFERASPQPAPVLGQHTDEILSAILGLPAHEIGRLHDEKVVGGPTR